MAHVHTMALEESVAGDASRTSSGVDAGHPDVNIDAVMLPITGTDHALAGEVQQGATTVLYGVSALWRTSRSYSKWNVVQACIFLMALSGAVLGTQHLITKMRAAYIFYADDHHSHHTPQLVSRASTDPYRLPQIFQVGGSNAVWTVPATADFFTSWASGISFRIGDVLQFSGGTGDIEEETSANYAGCINTEYLNYWYLNSVDLYIQLTEVKTYYFIQDDAVQCIQGLKISPTVNPMTIPAAPPRPNLDAPSRQPAIFQVGGDSATWTIPSSATFYEDWASNISFIVGDVLTFTVSDSIFEVDEVPYASYEKCALDSYSWYTTSSATHQLTIVGIKYYITNVPQNCIQGMKFFVNVYEPGSTMTPTPSPPPVTPSPPPITPSPPPITPSPPPITPSPPPITPSPITPPPIGSPPFIFKTPPPIVTPSPTPMSTSPFTPNSQPSGKSSLSLGGKLGIAASVVTIVSGIVGIIYKVKNKK